MNLLRLLRRNLVFHRRGNLAVLLGVAVGTAVLTGALLVGDSLRGSLRNRVMKQFRGFAFALSSPRFFREATVDEFSPHTCSREIVLQGSARSAVGSEPGIRVNKITIYGLPLERFEGASAYYDQQSRSVFQRMVGQRRKAPF